MIETERLFLRPWQKVDVPLYHAMASDPDFMRYIGPPMTIEACRAAAARQNEAIQSFGSCFWAVERRDTGGFIGYCGIKPGPDGSPIAGKPEIGWGIAPEHWGRGFALEAAQVCLDCAWTGSDWPMVQAMTVRANIASWSLMERLGMTRDADADFDHPGVPDDSPLKPHIVYRIERPISRPARP